MAGPWAHGTGSGRRCRSLVGIVCILLAAAYALARGYGGYVLSASAIPVFGLAWAAFWTGFLRVGAQSALLLAPLAAALLIVRWSLGSADDAGAHGPSTATLPRSLRLPIVLRSTTSWLLRLIRVPPLSPTDNAPHPHVRPQT